MPRKILIDCDPGHDDAIAIVLAHGNPDVELVGITTVAGNQTLDKVTRNARIIATVCGMTGVPIAAGADHPLVKELRTAPGIHGESGLDGPTLPEPTVGLDPRHAVDFLIETIMASEPGEITLVPMAPLTNIALAVRKCPEIVDRVAGVVLMGGGYAIGNVTATAEFNIFVDPEAAAVVFSAGWPITQVGLDLTHQALATPEVITRIDRIGTTVSTFVTDILRTFAANYRTESGFSAPPVHDPCAVAAVIDPAVFTTRSARVDLELTGTHTTGTTVTEFRQRDQPHNVQVAITLDVERFWDLIADAVERIG
jgi:purine nucleosidase